MTGGGPASACTDRLSVDVLEEAAALSNPSTGTIPPGYTNQQWREHYYYVLRKHGLTQSGNGVTSHGLRYQFLQQMYAALAGEPAPIKRAEECGPSELHREAWQRVGMIAGLSAATKVNVYIAVRRAGTRGVARSLTPKDAEQAMSKRAE